MVYPSSAIHTPRMILVPTTVDHLRIELDSPESLGEALCADVSPGWPPGMYDREAIQFFLEHTLRGGKESVGWFGWYAIRSAIDDHAPLLVASGGYAGPPSEDGTVEIGYSVVAEERRKGYATEIVNALVARALAAPTVKHIIAEVQESNDASIAVLVRCGFVRVGPGRDEGHFRYEFSGPTSSQS